MMKEHKEGSLPLCTFLVRMLQGMLIGLGSCPSREFQVVSCASFSEFTDL